MDNVWAHLACCFSTDALNWDFLGIYLVMLLGVHNFRNTSAMRVIFFSKMFEIKTRFQKIRKKLRESFLFWR